MPRTKKTTTKAKPKPRKPSPPKTLFSQQGSAGDGSCRQPLRSGKPVVVTGKDISRLKAVIRVGSYLGASRMEGDRAIKHSGGKLSVPNVGEKSEFFITFTEEGQSRSEPLWLEP